MAVVIILGVVILSDVYAVIEAHLSEFHYAEWCYAECHYAEWCYAECHYAECCILCLVC